MRTMRASDLRRNWAGHACVLDGEPATILDQPGFWTAIREDRTGRPIVVSWYGVDAVMRHGGKFKTTINHTSQVRKAI